MRFLGLEIVSRRTEQRASNWLVDDAVWHEVAAYNRGGASPDRAMRNSAVYACVNAIAEICASFPLILYRQNGRERERATDLPLYRKLNKFPNPRLTRFEWMQMMLYHLLLRGNAYSVIVMKGGELEGLYPLHPDYVKVEVVNPDELRYVWDPPSGQGKKVTYNQRQILHFRGPTDDGILGKSAIQTARDAIESGLSLDNYSKQIFENGVRPSGVLEHPGQLGKEARDGLAESFQRSYGGKANIGKVVVLEESMKFHQLSMTNRDAQYVEDKQFSITDIARIFRVPPHIIGDLTRATFSNIEEQNIEFKTYCLGPWLIRMELVLDRGLFGTDKSDLTLQFNMDAVLRGNTLSRYQAHQIGLQSGFLRFNDVRESENLNPFEWGDVSTIPLNMKVIRDANDLESDPDPAEPAPQEDTTPDGNADDQPAEEKSSGPDFARDLYRLRNVHLPIYARSVSKLDDRYNAAICKEFPDAEKYAAKADSFFKDQIRHARTGLLSLFCSYREQLVILASEHRLAVEPFSLEKMDERVLSYVAAQQERARGSDFRSPAPIETLGEQARDMIAWVEKITLGDSL